MAPNVSFPKKERLVYIFIQSSTYMNMAKKLYVGGLPYSTTEDQLRDAFAEAGSVDSASIIIDKMSGRSKGFGFVEMQDGDKAIAVMNGKELNGRVLTVNEARPMASRDSNSGFKRY